MRRRPMATLGLVAVVAAGAPSAVSAPEPQHGGARYQDLPRLKQIKELPQPRHGCKRLYTRKQHRRYVVRTYRSSQAVTKAKHHRSYVMSRCQYTARNERVAFRKWTKARRARARILSRGPRGLAFLVLRDYGQASQFGCLDALWARESGWSVTADNPSSSAYGIPQALPGSKMGPGWQYSARVQITWGIGYVNGRYGGPCNANAFQSSHRWY